jgi:hypothetical protein
MMCWFDDLAGVLSKSVSVAGCLGYDVLATETGPSRQTENRAAQHIIT